MGELSRKAYEKRVELEALERAKLRERVLFNTPHAAGAVEAAAQAEIDFGPRVGFTITASRYAVGGDEWFDLCGGPFETEWFDLRSGNCTLEDAARLAFEHRTDPRLVGWSIRVYSGLRSSGFTLREVMCLSELL